MDGINNAREASLSLLEKVRQPQAYLMLLLVFGAAAVVAMIKRMRSSIHNTKKKGYRAVPKAAETSMFTTMSKLQSVQSPFFLLEQARQTGSFVYQLALPGKGMVVVGDPRVARNVLTDPDSEKTGFFVDRPSKTSGSINMFGSKTTSSHWKVTRKGAAPAFSPREVHRMRAVARKHLQHWITNTLEPLVESGGTFDPNREMTRLTLRIIIDAAFEYEELTEEQIDLFLSEVELCLREFSFRQLFNPIRRTFEWFFPEGRRAHAAAKKIQAFAWTILEAYRNQQKAREKKGGSNDEKKDDDSKNDNSPKTVIRLVVENTHLTDKHRIGEMVTFLIAGYDTTGYTLSNALYKLAEKPKIAQKLQAALKASERNPLPSKSSSSVSSSSSSSSVASQEDIWRSCEYLQYVIKENFRILPVAALGSIREVKRDFVFSMPTDDQDNDGSEEKPQTEQQYMIPKGMRMIMPQTVIHHNDHIFDHADEFTPERWQNATQEMNQSILTFSAGARNCIGQSLATAEIQTILPRLLRHYKFTIERPGEIDYFLTMKVANSRLSVQRVEE